MRPKRKSCATPPGTEYSPVRQSPIQLLPFATGAIAPPTPQPGLSASTPIAWASWGHSWCSSNSQYGHECVPDGR